MAAMQQHLHTCIKTGWELKVMVQRLTDDQLLALENPSSDDSSSHDCHLSGEHHSTAEKLQQHVELPEYEDVHSPISILYTCAMCGENFKDSVDYKIHLVQSHDGVFTCIYQNCNQVFQNNKDLEKHCNQVHKDFEPFQCRICLSSCKSESDLQLHNINAHCIWPYNCEVCGKGYISMKLFKQHVEAHTADSGVYKCLHGACQDSFSTPSNLMTHMKQHLKTFSCDVPDCYFTSNTILDLQFHKSSVHSIWMYKCELCDQGFDRSNDLKQHKECHKSKVPSALQCNYKECKQTFTSATDLKKHTVEHWYPKHIKRQLSDEDSNLNDQQLPLKIEQDETALVCKDEIEEVVFD